MFTPAQLTQILHAIDLAQKSNTRAMNNSKNPEFKELYQKMDRELNDTAVIVRTELAKPNNTRK